MEKMSVEDHGRLWHLSDDGTLIDGRDQTPGLAEMMCCPCVNYARTSARLDSALRGKPEGVEKPNIGCCSTECFQFSLCIPFYGLMAAKLQGTVRALYDIDGSHSSDWADGCCCPCATMARNEEEVVFRTRIQQKVKGLHVCDFGDRSSTQEYAAQVPMSFGSPRTIQTPQISSPPHARSATYNEEAENDQAALGAIPERARAAIAGPSLKSSNLPPKPEKKITTATSPGSPEMMPDDQRLVVSSPFSPRPLMEYLGHKWYLVPVDKENDDPVEGKGKSRSEDEPKQHQPEKPQSRVSFENDPVQTVHTRSGNVSGQDKHQPVQALPRISLEKAKHEIGQAHPRSSLEKAKPEIGQPHLRSSLERARPKATHAHPLDQDQQHDATPTVETHTLDHDERHQEPPAIQTHLLEDEPYHTHQSHAGTSVDAEGGDATQSHPFDQKKDASEDAPKQQMFLRKIEGPLKPVIEHSKSRFTEHLLEDDHYYVPSPTRNGSPHFLSADAMVSRIHAHGSPHSLEDEPVGQRGPAKTGDEPTAQNASATANEEESNNKKDEESNKTKGHALHDELAKGKSVMRKGLKGLMGRNERRTSEMSDTEESTTRKEPVVTELPRLVVTEESEGAWVRGFWPGAFSSSSQPATVSHEIDDDARVTTRPEVTPSHTIDTDEKVHKAQPELAEASKRKDTIVGKDMSVDVTDARTTDNTNPKANDKTDVKVDAKADAKVDDKPAERSTKVTGSKIAKAASQFFGAGGK